MNIENIRNFCIIAHIDHGKSTLADRLLEETSTLSSKEMRDQVLDNMDIERERGITIKSHAIRMNYKTNDGETYELNLIDTPGHVDFSYEVSRSLAACEGALLVVDATQGVEAQTISNFYLAFEYDLTIIPVINKIDLPAADIDATASQIMELMDVKEEEILNVSAREGTGVHDILEAIVKLIPPPPGDSEAPLRALVFDSDYDTYRGAVAYVRIVDGILKSGQQIYFMKKGRKTDAQEVGFMRLEQNPVPELKTGEVGYLFSGIKQVRDVGVGDTVTDLRNPTDVPLPGYKEAKPMIFAGLYPSDPDHFTSLRDALEKLMLNDSSLVFEPESSLSLGFGFRCGFLGLLHMDIIQERLDREYSVDIVTTVPSVRYRATLKSGNMVDIDNPAKFPKVVLIDFLEEPILDAQIVTPLNYMGNVMKLIRDRRGVLKETEYLDGTRVNLLIELPLAEMVFDFYDKLKSISQGYASFDYEFREYRKSDVVKLDILLNGESVDALSAVLHREKAVQWGRALCKRLKELIPRQMFSVIIQGALGGKIVARETVRPLRKNVTAKCYGGDITRKRKLLEKQKEGKKRMKQVGKVRIPQEAFHAVLSMDKD